MFWQRKTTTEVTVYRPPTPQISFRYGDLWLDAHFNDPTTIRLPRWHPAISYEQVFLWRLRAWHGGKPTKWWWLTEAFDEGMSPHEYAYHSNWMLEQYRSLRPGGRYETGSILPKGMTAQEYEQRAMREWPEIEAAYDRWLATYRGPILMPEVTITLTIRHPTGARYGDYWLEANMNTPAGILLVPHHPAKSFEQEFLRAIRVMKVHKIIKWKWLTSWGPLHSGDLRQFINLGHAEYRHWRYDQATMDQIRREGATPLIEQEKQIVHDWFEIEAAYQRWYQQQTQQTTIQVSFTQISITEIRRRY
jgi:hypothetical protein